jgi:hypothetical protein
MNPAPRWGLALEGSDPAATLRWIVERIWPDRVPYELTLDARERKLSVGWLDRVLASGAKQDGFAVYFSADRRESLSMHSRRLVKARFPFELDIAAAQRLLEDAPFEVASFESLYDWSEIDPRYTPPSFSRSHFRHGWGCAFKGVGHDRLVSRRWVEFGPWRLLRGENDLSLIQFHDLDAPPQVALAQAKPGHTTMGIDDAGGFLQQPYVFETTFSGLYDATEQALRIIVTGRETPAVELRDARAAVKQGALSADRPLKRLLYVFTNPQEAQRTLHALWLRELECWTIVDGVEQRLDDRYTPVPQPPAWVKAI